MPRPPPSFIRRLLRGLLAGLMLPVLLFEQWGWVPLSRAMAWLARHPVLAAVERRVRGLPPWAALLSFFLPMLLLFPIKLAALWLFAQGRVLAGVLLLGAAKLLGTALVARIFQLTRPALMRIPAFARGYTAWKTWKDGLLRSLRALAVWRAARRAGLALRRLGRRGLRAWRRSSRR